MTVSHSPDKTITVLGAGYVGLTTAAVFANSGFRVYLIDPNQQRLNVIKNGKAWFYEPGINNLVRKAVDSTMLLPTRSYATAIPESKFIFSCVGTPDNPDGSPNLTYVFEAFQSCLPLVREDAIFIQKSTVPVGTGQQLEDLARQHGTTITYVSNPEFLREGSALADTIWFDRVVCGSEDGRAATMVSELYKAIEHHKADLSQLSGASKPTAAAAAGTYFITTRNSAELIKVTANAFLALKISFANTIAKLADSTNADVNEVMDAVGADRRIGRAFLNAGRGYGGGCFPKDVSGLIDSATKHGIDMQILRAATEVNETMPGYIVNKAKDVLGELKDKKCAVLGLAFKANTSDARKSPAVFLANILAKNKAQVRAYDPKASEEAGPELRREVKLCKTAQEALTDADAVFVATAWDEFLKLDLTAVRKNMSGKLFVDCMNSFNISEVEKSGLQYLGVGRNGSKNGN